jgi:thioesterase-3
MPATEIFIKVRNYHADNHRHVNNARYLEFFEEGSWDYIEKNASVGQLFEALKQEGILHVAVNINCSYRGRGRVGDLLRIETDLMRSTARSFVWSKKVFNHHTGQLLVEAETTCAFVDAATGRAVAIDDRIRTAWPELAARRVNKAER